MEFDFFSWGTLHLQEPFYFMDNVFIVYIENLKNTVLINKWLKATINIKCKTFYDIMNSEDCILLHWKSSTWLLHNSFQRTVLIWSDCKKHLVQNTLKTQFSKYLTGLKKRMTYSQLPVFYSWILKRWKLFTAALNSRPLCVCVCLN